MPQCRVFHCDVNAGDTKNGISTHRFPKRNPELCRAWMVVCKIQWPGSLKNYNFKDHFICSRHFQESDFQDDVYSKIMMQEGAITKARPRRLKKQAIPTLNLTGQQEKSRRAASERRNEEEQRQAQKRVVHELTRISCEESANEDPGPSKMRRPNDDDISATCSIQETGDPVVFEDDSGVATLEPTASGSPLVEDERRSSLVEDESGSSLVEDESGSSLVEDDSGSSLGEGESGSSLVEDETGSIQSKEVASQVASVGTSDNSEGAKETSPIILPLEFHDFPLKRNIQTQTAPPVSSTVTQTDWADPILKDHILQHPPHPCNCQATPAQPPAMPRQPPPPAMPIQPPAMPVQIPIQIPSTSFMKAMHSYDLPTPKKRPPPTMKTPIQLKPRKVVYRDDTEPIEEEGEILDKRDVADDDYDPSSESSSSSEESDEEVDRVKQVASEKKYIVFESCLKNLILRCRCATCGSVLILNEKWSHTKGSMLTVKAACLKHGHPWSWNSQPLLGVGKEAVPAGNLMLSASMLFSGSSFSKVSQMAKFLKLEFISESCKTDHDNDWIFPEVHETWYHEKHTLWRTLDGTSVQLSGDGRCDSPGYSAKYCTYVMMDMDSGKIIDIETLSVNETSSSNAMEKEACHRLLNNLGANNVEVSVLCTDRHASIAKLLRDHFPGINHQFDLWHLAKSATKKLNAKAKQKECQDLGPWIPSIRNHMWWAAASCGGDTVELTEKWRSVVHHTVDRHEWDNSQKYQECQHGPLSEEERAAKKWLVEGSEAHEALGAVINNTSILKGVKQVNLFCHTGKTEVFNSSLLKFCPKRVHFPYEGMVVRTRLAAIENNMNTGRAQARVQHETKNSGPVGSLRFRAVCPKAKKDWVAKPIYEQKDYSFVDGMMERVLRRKVANKKGTSPMYFDPPAKALEKNIAPIENPGKDVVTARHKNRFGRDAD